VRKKETTELFPVVHELEWGGLQVVATAVYLWAKSVQLLAGCSFVHVV
jgi:hypothetical protein